MDAPRRPRDLKDRALALVSGLLAGGRVPFMRRGPHLTAVLESRMWEMAPSKQETDRTFRTADGTLWTLEFQFRVAQAEIARMAGYHLTLVRQHPRHAVQTMVLWGTRRPPARALHVQQVTFRARQVFLRSLVAEDDLARWRWVAERRGRLPREAAMELTAVPLMGRTVAMRALLEQALALAERLDPDLRDAVRGAMLCLGYDALPDPSDRAWARKGLSGVPVKDQLWEDLKRDLMEIYHADWRAEGRAEGALAQARVWLAEAFRGRFGAVPAAVEQAIAATTDLAQLSAWHRYVIAAKPESPALDPCASGARW